MPYSWTLIETTYTPPVDADAEEEVARDFALDPVTHDLIVSPGMQLVRGREAIAQNIFLRVSMFKGEWFLNPDEGTDWFGSILGKNKDMTLARTVLRERIMGTPGVLDLTELSFDLDRGARVLSASWNVTTDLGALKQVAELVPGVA